MPYPATLPLRFSHPDPLITQNPAPVLNWNSASRSYFQLPSRISPQKLSKSRIPPNLLWTLFLVEGEKFKLRNLPSRISCLFSSRRRACLVLKQLRKWSFKRLRYMMLSITVKEITFWNSKRLSLNKLTSRPQNLCHNLKRFGVCLFSILMVSSQRTKYKSYLRNYMRSSCRFKPILSEKLPKTILCISESARILNNSQPQNLCHRVKYVWCLFVFNLDVLKLENEVKKLLK